MRRISLAARPLGLILTVLSVLALAATVWAALLSPGATVTPVPAIPYPGGTIVGGVPYTVVTGSDVDGILLFPTERNSAGTLDFYLQYILSDTAPDTLNRITVSSFAGYITDVYYITGPVSAALSGDGTVAPISVDRNAGGVPGKTVSFNFAEGSFLPGAISYPLLIRTNAVSYEQLGNAGIVDGHVTNAQVRQPIGPTATPGTAAPAVSPTASLTSTLTPTHTPSNRLTAIAQTPMVLSSTTTPAPTGTAAATLTSVSTATVTPTATTCVGRFCL